MIDFIVDNVRWVMDWFTYQWLFSIVLLFVSFGAIMGGVAYASLYERKIAAWLQDRIGPNRVGVFGLFGWRLKGHGQPIADGIKFFLKEDLVPSHVDKILYFVGPGLSMAVPMLLMAVIPWSGWLDVNFDGQGKYLVEHNQVTVVDDISLGNADVICQVVNIDVAVLYMLAAGSLGAYGIVIAAWASNNKYSLYGGVRAVAQMISYEIPLGLGIMVVVLCSGQFDLQKIILSQIGDGNCWYAVKHPLAFFLVWVTMLAEANRMPFDLAESEQELVGGFHTEYSSMKFSLFFMGEYLHMIVGAAFLSTLFLGGWHIPWIPWCQPEATGWFSMFAKAAVVAGKVGFFVFLAMIVRWTLVRFRFDQLMRLCWQKLIPLGIGVVLVAAVVVAFGGPSLPLWKQIGISWAGNAVVLGIAAYIAARAFARQEKVTGRQHNMARV